MSDPGIPVGERSAGGAGETFGAHYYRHDCGIPYERNERWLGFFDKIAEGIVRDLHPASVLDAGCAMGFLVEMLNRRAVDAWGVDISEYAISKVDESVDERCRVGSLTEPLDRRYDLIVCIEVLEHIPADEVNDAIANLCGATDRLLLSASPNDYGEATHVNVQPPESWAAALAREGFLRDLERDFTYITPWTSLYSRAEETVEETVRRYDRAWSRRRQEAIEVRTILLETQRQAAAAEAELEKERSEPEASPELLQRLDTLEEENLRLRDLLVGRDAELGSARGQLAMHEDYMRRLSGALGRIQSKIPGGTRLFGAMLRWLQGRKG